MCNFMSSGGRQISHNILTYITHKGTATICVYFLLQVFGTHPTQDKL